MSELFQPGDVATKLALSIGVGLLVGFEREWSQKDLGVRIFALTALLGTISSLIDYRFALTALAIVALLVALVNTRNIVRGQSLEITTSIALSVSFVMGVLIGQGHYFAPIAAAILVTLILSLKTELTRFAGGLRPEEIRSAVLLGLIGFVIYPILPNRNLDRWQLISPREIWITVMIVSGIGFLNYVLLRIYGKCGLYYTAVLGGLVNSTATVAELSNWFVAAGPEFLPSAIVALLLTVVAMFVRNWANLVIFAPSAASLALWPLMAMAIVAVYFAWRRRDREATRPTGELQLSSPVSLKKIINFGLLFLIIQVAGTLGARHLGKFGFLIVSLFGGLVSSASTTAAAATMTLHGRLSSSTAATAAVIASIASALVNIPLVYRQTRHKELTRTLSVTSFLLVLIGLAVLEYKERFW